MADLIWSWFQKAVQTYRLQVFTLKLDKLFEAEFKLKTIAFRKVCSSTVLESMNGAILRTQEAMDIIVLS